MNEEALKELAKALEDDGGLHGYVANIMKAINNSTGFSTRQSLSAQVKDLTRRTTPLVDMLSREPVINPVHQWDSITSLATGIGSYAGAIDSVGLDSDPIISRSSEAVRYYRTTTTVGQFTQAMSRPELPAQPTVDEKAIQAVRQDIERDLFHGIKDSFPIRGIDQVIGELSAPEQSISANAPITETTEVDTLQRRIVEQGGLASHVLLNPEDNIDFRNIFSADLTYNDPQDTTRFGYAVNRYLSPFGEVEIMWDQFINAKAGGGTPVSTYFVLDLTTWKLGEPVVNGASGIAMQDLAKTGPANTKLINYYGLLQYVAPVHNARVLNVQ